jgi:3-oxo-5alpha-steroid 4-dehydrogenase
MSDKKDGEYWKFGDTGATGTPIAKPVIADSAEAVAWNVSCDMLVIGCGVAGASAALKASETGASVIVADRSNGGGASQLSGGILYLGGGTRVQQELGVCDDPENFANYPEYEVGNAVSRQTVERFSREAASFIPWLE